jgi:hypothetical protein
MQRTEPFDTPGRKKRTKSRPFEYRSVGYRSKKLSQGLRPRTARSLSAPSVCRPIGRWHQVPASVSTWRFSARSYEAPSPVAPQPAEPHEIAACAPLGTAHAGPSPPEMTRSSTNFSPHRRSDPTGGAAQGNDDASFGVTNRGGRYDAPRPEKDDHSVVSDCPCPL